jgi:hypothetical protein
VVDASGDEGVDVSGGGVVDVNGGEAVDVSGGGHGRENGDGQSAFSCSIDYGGVWKFVDTPPAHLLTNSDQIPIRLPHLGEHPQSLVPCMNSTRRVSPQEQALQFLLLLGVNEAIADVDVHERISQCCCHCGSQARL